MEEYFDYRECLRITARRIDCYHFDGSESYHSDYDQQDLLEDLKDRSNF